MSRSHKDAIYMRVCYVLCVSCAMYVASYGLTGNGVCMRDGMGNGLWVRAGWLLMTGW